jgi:hypothetical protein
VFEGCVTVSVLIHYFTLVAVMWMGAEALLMFQKLVIVFVQITTRYIVIVSLVCWLAPLLPVIISVSINPRFMVSYRQVPTLAPNVTVGEEPDFCFIGEPGVLFGAFLVPILAILVFNAIVFVIVIRVLFKHSRKKHGNRDVKVVNTVRQMLISSSGIMFLFGLSWAFGALTISAASVVFQYLFAIFTSLQGFFIFLFFCVLGKEARELWLQVLCRGRKRPWFTSTTSQPKTPAFSTSGISSGGTGTTTASSTTPRHIFMGSIYLRRPSAIPSILSSVSRRASETPSIGNESVSSIEMNPMEGTIQNLHAIQEDEEEEIMAMPTPSSGVSSPMGKRRQNSNTESVLDLSLGESTSNKELPTSPQTHGSVTQRQELSTTDEDFEVLENPHAD